MIPDNPKGISKLRFWGKNRRINGISELPAFMQQRVSTFKTRRSLALENLALRQQLAVLQRSVKRPRLSNLDRGLCVLLRRFWTDWAKVLVIVKPDTVVRWHRAGFRRYWAWRSRRLRPGRPCVAPEVRELIRNMCRANPLWGAPRVHGELAKLGISISQAAVSKYMIRRRKPPSQTWRSFSTIMSRTWCPSTSSCCRPPPSGFCSFSSFSVTIAGASSISMSRRILRQSGPRSRSSRPFRGIRRRVTCCETGMKLRGVLQTGRCGTRHRAGCDGAALSVAEPLRRTGHWKHSARVSRSRDRPRRATPQANPARIRRLLSFLPDSFIARERCPRATTCAVALDGARNSHSEGRRPPSLLQSSRCLSSLRLTRCPWDTSQDVLGRASIPRTP